MSDEKKSKASANGSTGDAARAKQREERRRNRGTGSVCDWSSADSGLLREAIQRVTDCGFAITFGYTRDKGSYTIRVIGDDNAEPIYVRSTESVDTTLQEIVYIYE